MMEPQSVQEAGAIALDVFYQLEETARGMREHMLRNGWGEEAAEEAAVAWLLRVLSGE